MPLPNAARDYLIKGLDGSPVVLSGLLGDRIDSDSIWDRRPDPDRFTLREALAHLADWEPIWLERIQKIQAGYHPFLPSVDEGALAEEHNYAASSPNDRLERYTEGRAKLVEHLKTIQDDEWDLTCEREFVGVLTLQQQVYYILAHDAYHLRQVAEWVK
ncbi:MAG: DinB family protein [Fimbriimonadales bacterium]